MARVQCAIRMPEDLKRFIGEVSKKRGRTETAFIVNACWCYLEEPPSEAGGSIQSAAIKMNDAMAKSVSAMPTPVSSDFLEDTQPIRLCLKTGFNETDGETYRCSLAAGHKFNCKPGERV